MNLWRRFQSMASPPSLVTVGRVIAAEDGMSTVEFPSGSRARVQGTGEVGQSYYIRENRLDAEAPSLAPVTIEV